MKLVRGITLVEVLIVVLVLTILASVVTPQLSRASGDARFDAMQAHLQDVRGQIRLYHTQHDGKYPSLGDFVAQMTQYTDANGQPCPRSTDSCNLGPYLLNVPSNPYTGGNRIGDGSVGTSDWFYNAQTGAFRANHGTRNTEFDATLSQ